MSKSKKDYILIPKTVLDLSDEIKKAVDDYWNRELAEIELKEIIWVYAGGGKLLKGDKFNKTVQKYCGKARMEVVGKLLEGYQRRI